MGIQELTESMAWKRFIAKLYGIGASVVIIGALFKIQHWPGAGIMLTVGLGTEAIIFFFSAFEPVHKEYPGVDWTRVYPELAEDYEEELEDKHHKKKSSGSLTGELDKMLEEAKIGPELIKSLGTGLANLSENANKLANVSNGVVATEEFASKIKIASKSVEDLSGAYNKNLEVINNKIAKENEYVNNISNVSKSVSEVGKVNSQIAGATQELANNVSSASKSINELKDTYVKTTDALLKSTSAIDFSSVDGKTYAEQLKTMSTKLEALNSIYDLQLKSVKAQIEGVNKVSENINKFIDNLTSTSQDAQKFKEELAKLNKNISSLNNIYGNMLSAMSIKS